MTRRTALLATLALSGATFTPAVAQTQTTIPGQIPPRAETLLEREPLEVVLVPGAAYGFFGPRRFLNLRPSPVVRIPIPPALLTVSDRYEVQRDGARVQVRFASEASLAAVYAFYRELLQRQGFEEVRVARPEADEVTAAFRREESALTFRVEREDDLVYEVLFDLLPTAGD